MSEATKQQREYEVRMHERIAPADLVQALAQGWELFPCIVLRRPVDRPKVLAGTAMDLQQIERRLPPPKSGG